MEEVFDANDGFPIYCSDCRIVSFAQPDQARLYRYREEPGLNHVRSACPHCESVVHVFCDDVACVALQFLGYKVKTYQHAPAFIRRAWDRINEPKVAELRQELENASADDFGR